MSLYRRLLEDDLSENPENMPLRTKLLSEEDLDEEDEQEEEAEFYCSYCGLPQETPGGCEECFETGRGQGLW